MDLFIVGVFEAIIATLLGFFLGKKLVDALSAISTSAIILPLALIIIGSTIKMMNAPPETVATVGNAAVTNIWAYITGQLPGIFASDLCGAVVGAVVGVFAARKSNSWN